MDRQKGIAIVSNVLGLAIGAGWGIFIMVKLLIPLLEEPYENFGGPHGYLAIFPVYLMLLCAYTVFMARIVTCVLHTIMYGISVRYGFVVENQSSEDGR